MKNRVKLLGYFVTLDSGPGNKKSLTLSANPDVEKAVCTRLLQDRSGGIIPIIKSYVKGNIDFLLIVTCQKA